VPSTKAKNYTNNQLEQFQEFVIKAVDADSKTDIGGFDGAT
jgi:hypothetical protein